MCGAANMVREAMNPWVDGVNFGARAVVKYIGASKELMVAYFITFDVEAIFAKLKD
jgi:hypothetical protein